MKLHANAATCPKSRLTIVCRVVDGEARETVAAEYEISTGRSRSGSARYRAEGEAGLVDRCSAPGSIPHRTRGGSGGGDRGVAAVADDRRGDRDVSGDAALDGLGGAGAGRAGQAQPAGAARAAQSLRARHGRASWSTSTSRSSGGSTAAGHRVNGRRASQNVTRRGAGSGKAPSAGSSCTSASTTPPAWPTSRCSPTNKATTAVAFCAARSPSTPATASPCERVMTDNGACYRSTIHAFACRAARPAPPAHPALPAAHQRQSRALHPHHARRLGLRRDLRHQRANAPQPLTAGSGPTTIAAHTAPSATSRPSARLTRADRPHRRLKQLARAAAQAAARASARSSTRSTKAANEMPAASAASGSSDVSVRPGIALASSTVSSPVAVVEHQVDAGEAVAAEHAVGVERELLGARASSPASRSAGQTKSVRPIS